MQNTTLIYIKRLCAMAGSAAVLCSSLSAATWTVTTTSDSRNGSLRDALTQAQNGDTINFATQLSGTIVLTDNLPIINQDLVINGNGAVTIDGQNSYPIFFVNAGNVLIDNLTLNNGMSQGGLGADSHSGGGGGGFGAGGAVFVNTPASVALTSIAFNNNQAHGGDGGGMISIYNTGAGGGGGGGMLGGNGGSGNFNYNNGSGGGGGGGLASTGGSAFASGGGGGGFKGIINGQVINGDGLSANTNGGSGGNGFATSTGGAGGVSDSVSINGSDGNSTLGGGGGGGGANTTGSLAGLGGDGGTIGGGGGGGGGATGGNGGNGGAFSGGGGGGGFNSSGGAGGFGGGGGGGSLNPGGNGGFGGGGGGGGSLNPGGAGQGGGNGGNNLGGGGGGAGYGGAIFVRQGGSISLQDCTFNGNSVLGGSGGGNGATAGDSAGSDLYTMANSSIAFVQNSDSSAYLSGSGTLTFEGQSMLSINSVDGFSGNIYLSSGVLALTGNFDGSIANISDKGTLQYIGAMKTINNSSGTISFGPSFGTISLDHNLTISSGSALAIKVQPNGNCDQIVLQGSASLSGSLHISPSPGLYPQGTSFTIINAKKGVSGTFKKIFIDNTTSNINFNITYGSKTATLTVKTTTRVK